MRLDKTDLAAGAFMLCMAALVGIALSIFDGCTGAQPKPGGVPTPWTVTVSISISAARAAGSAATAAIDASPNASADMKAIAARVQRDLNDSLDAATSALAVYQSSRSTNAQCELHGVLDNSITLAVQLMAIANDVGARIPPEVPAAVGALGAFADAVMSGECIPDGGASAEQLSEQTRVRNALRRLAR